MRGNPWLSVVIPTYNGERHLKTALDSIPGDVAPDVEVIVVDDGSTDGTLKLVESYRGRFDLMILKEDHTGNWVRNTCLGMSQSRGEFICWLHHDDAWIPGRFTALRALVRDFPDAEFVFHPSQYINEAGVPMGHLRCPFPAVRGRVAAADLTRHLLIQNFISAPATLIHKSCLAKVGLPDDRLWYVADWEYWLRLAEACHSVFCPEPLTAYRIHAHSMTSCETGRFEQLEGQYAEVLARHVPAWMSMNPPASENATVPKVAKFSADVNLALMRCVRGDPLALCRLVPQSLRLGPRGLRTFITSSRILERCWNRLRM